ncbi:MAG: hypothetical protein HQM16_16530 [Deltaproteobacteria bacterium]|nr:hypothetical protein [Deltaproteobacteria bacterium]
MFNNATQKKQTAIISIVLLLEIVFYNLTMPMVEGLGENIDVHFNLKTVLTGSLSILLQITLLGILFVGLVKVFKGKQAIKDYVFLITRTMLVPHLSLAALFLLIAIFYNYSSAAINYSVLALDITLLYGLFVVIFSSIYTAKELKRLEGYNAFKSGLITFCTFAAFAICNTLLLHGVGSILNKF